MLIDFFLHLKSRKLPVSTREYLDLLAAMQARVASHSIDDFYVLSRTLLVKDEANYDKFDRAFGEYFRGIERLPGLVELAMGIHCANNLISSLLITSPNGILKTDAIFVGKSENPGGEFLTWFVLAAITFTIFWLKYRWKNFNLLIK